MSKSRLDDIMLAAFKKDLCSFQETITILLSVHMLGSLEPIGHLEKARQALIKSHDGSVDKQDAFREMYDWTRVRDDLQELSNGIATTAGSDKPPEDIACELESLARWIRLQQEDWQD